MQTIVFTRGDTLCLVSPVLSSQLTIEQIAEKCVPVGLTYYVVDSSVLPADSTFSPAWELDASQQDTTVTVNMLKAREIGHEIRRAKRAVEFAPLDEQIMKQIPGTDTTAVEAQRQAIREKYARIQTQIDAAETPDEIKAALEMK